MIKTEQGGKPAVRDNKGLMVEETKEEKDVRVLKGLFNSLGAKKAGISKLDSV